MKEMKKAEMIEEEMMKEEGIGGLGGRQKRWTFRMWSAGDEGGRRSRRRQRRCSKEDENACYAEEDIRLWSVIIMRSFGLRQNTIFLSRPELHDAESARELDIIDLLADGTSKTKNNLNKSLSLLNFLSFKPNFKPSIARPLVSGSQDQRLSRLEFSQKRLSQRITHVMNI